LRQNYSKKKKQGTKDFFVVKLIFCLHEGRRRISDKENESQTAKKGTDISDFKVHGKMFKVFTTIIVLWITLFFMSLILSVIKYPLYVQFYQKRLFESCLAPIFYISQLKKYD